MSEAKRKQVGGDHYAKLEVQPFDIFKSMGIFEEVCQANIIKYVMRYQNKGGLQDLAKAAHYLEELIRFHDEKTIAQVDQPCTCAINKGLTCEECAEIDGM